MSRWWRAYEEAATDPKLQLLPAELFRTWFNLMCIASRHGGELPSLEHIAYTLQMKPEKAALALTKLHKAELLDKTETGFTPHNWHGRQYKSDRDDTAAKRAKKYRDARRDGNASVTRCVTRDGHTGVTRDVTQTSRPPETETETEAETETDSEAIASGADAPPDPAIAEREFFARGKQILGKSAGGQLAKLKTAKGGNVALARAALETASTKQNPAEYIAGVIRAGADPPLRAMTVAQRNRQETREILDDLEDFARRSGGSGEADFGVLPGHPGERSETLRGGTGRAVVDLSGSGRRESS